jgi:hypothetical protein
MRRALLAGVALPCAVGVGACDRGGAPATDAAPATGATASASSPTLDASRPTGPHWGELAKGAARLPCRATTAEGDLRAEGMALPGAAHGMAGPDAGAGRALAAAQEIPPETWILLGPSSRLIAKDPRTTRETTFLGAGRARPCVERREESWVAAGAFESVVGAGESPGSEEWVVTPLAVLRYGSAKVRVVVGAKGTAITPASGVAFAWIAGDARARWGADGGAEAPKTAVDGWERVADAPVAIVPVAATTAPQAARAALDHCGTLADRSHELASMLVMPSVGLPDASAVADQVVARRLARAACAVAALRVGALADGAPKEALSAKLNEAVATWTALPAVVNERNERNEGNESDGAVGAPVSSH